MFSLDLKERDQAVLAALIENAISSLNDVIDKPDDSADFKEALSELESVLEIKAQMERQGVLLPDGNEFQGREGHVSI